MTDTGTAYSFTVEAGSPDREIWQIVHYEDVTHDGTALDLAEVVVQNTNVIDTSEGAWRVRVYLGHGREGCPVTQIDDADTSLYEISKAISQLAYQTPIQRAIDAKNLYQVLRHRLPQIHREAVYEATRIGKANAVAAKIGVSHARVNQIVTDHHYIMRNSRPSE